MSAASRMVSQSDRLPMMMPTRGESAISAVMPLKKGDIILNAAVAVERGHPVDPDQGPDRPKR
jgi:hypothetical protein